jgi:hypothetical protein
MQENEKEEARLEARDHSGQKQSIQPVDLKPINESSVSQIFHDNIVKLLNLFQ